MWRHEGYWVCGETPQSPRTSLILLLPFSIIPLLSTALTFSSHPSNWNPLNSLPVPLPLLSISSKEQNLQTHLVSPTTSFHHSRTWYWFFPFITDQCWASETSRSPLLDSLQVSALAWKLKYSLYSSWNSISQWTYRQAESQYVISHFIPIPICCHFCMFKGYKSPTVCCYDLFPLLDSGFQSFWNCITGRISWGGTRYSRESCQSNSISGSAAWLPKDGVLLSLIKKIIHAESNSVRSCHADLA